MTERIDNLIYVDPAPSGTLEGVETTLYLTGPAEFLCAKIVEKLLDDTVWSRLFGPNIDPYKRMDYSIRALPAMRIYNNTYVKTAESWFVDGDIVCDLIFPANIRRKELQQIPDTVTSALMQQFRRPTFFTELCEVTPGLNELGKRFDVDKSLAFEWGEDLVPLTQVTLNFRIDLRAWDNYLESDNRTKDQPFERPLGDLEQIVSLIQGLRDDNETVDVALEADQRIEEEI
jgi:hypothetical protein